ncbi:MAG TPA: tetratricopeptide repeat protein [Drouetiella sp.]|jgi:hypothetical protein
MFTRKNQLATLALAVISCSVHAAFARSKFSDPGILLSSKTVKGITTERYSDGTTVEYTLKGFRREQLEDDSSYAEMTPGTNSDAASWVREFMYFPDFSAPPNDAGLQSRLRQYVEICLSENHGSRALKEAQRYLEIQQTIKATGLPLVIGQELLGRVYLQIGNEEGSKLLADAARIADGLNNGELKREIRSQLTGARKPSEYTSSADLYPGLTRNIAIAPVPEVCTSETRHLFIKRSPILSLLERSKIEARNGNSQKAMNDAVNAITLCSESAPGKNADLNRTFNEAYRMNISEIARLFSLRKHHRGDAIQLLMLANSKMSKGASAYVDLPFQSNRYYGGYYARIDLLLAQLLLEEGRNREALTAIQNAIKYSSPNNASESTLRLAAEIAEKCHQFGTAAEYYSKAEITSGSHVDQHASNEVRVNLLRKAAECNQKSSSFNRVESANIAVRLGRLLESSHPEEALHNYELACALVSDSNPNKVKLLDRIAHLKSINLLKNIVPPNVVAQDNLPTGLDPALKQRLKDILKQPPHAQGAPWTEEQLIAEGVRQSAAQFEQIKASAEISEKMHREDAWRNWREFATAEAQIGDLDNAIKAARHAIALYKRREWIPIYWDSTLITGGDYRSLADVLRRHGRDADARLLLDEAIDKLSAEYGAKSAAVAIQYATIVAFYASSNRDSEALKKLDAMLELPARVVDVGSRYESALGRLYGVVNSLRQKKRMELARAILQHVMKSQIAQLGPDDYRLSTTKIEASQLAQSVGNYSEEARKLFEAIRIRTKFSGVSAIAQESSELQKLLPKIGREEDNKWVEVSPVGRLNPAILRQFGYVEEAKSLEEDGRLPKTFVDAEHFNDYQRVADLDLQNEADRAFKQCPYSPRTFQANLRLMQNSLSSMNWSVLEKSGSTLAEIYEHSSDNTAGRQIGCVISDVSRIDYYLAAAKANFKLGKTKQAQDWIDRAINVLPEISSSEYEALGEMEVELGNKIAAKKYLDRSQSSTMNNALPYLYKKIGEVESARKARAKIDAHHLEYRRSRAETESQDHMFDHVQF